MNIIYTAHLLGEVAKNMSKKPLVNYDYESDIL